MFGIKANIKAPHKFMRMGAKCLVIQGNPGNAHDHIQVRGMSRGGRIVETYVDSRDLGTFRASWITDADAESCWLKFEDRAAAEALAASLQSRYGDQDVREHAAAYGR